MRKSKNTGELFVEVMWAPRKGESDEKCDVLPFNLVKQMDPIAMLEYFELCGKFYSDRYACYPRYFAKETIEKQEKERNSKETEREVNKIKHCKKFWLIIII